MTKKASTKKATPRKKPGPKSTLLSVFKERFARSVLVPELARINEEYHPESVEALLDLFRAEHGVGTSDVELLSFLPEDLSPYTCVRFPGDASHQDIRVQAPPQPVDLSALFDSPEEETGEHPRMDPIPDITEGPAFRGGPPSNTPGAFGGVLPGGPGHNIMTAPPRG